MIKGPGDGPAAMTCGAGAGTSTVVATVFGGGNGGSTQGGNDGAETGGRDAPGGPSASSFNNSGLRPSGRHGDGQGGGQSGRQSVLKHP